MKYKVHNRNPFNVGLNFMDGLRSITIPKKSFTLLDEDEIYYQNTISTLFQKGVLTVDEDEIKKNLNLDTEKNSNAITDEDIKNILKGSLAKIKKDLSGINEPYAKSKVFEIAKDMYSNLSGGKIDYIASFCGRDKADFETSIKENEEKK